MAGNGMNWTPTHLDNKEEPGPVSLDLKLSPRGWTIHWNWQNIVGCLSERQMGKEEAERLCSSATCPCRAASYILQLFQTPDTQRRCAPNKKSVPRCFLQPCPSLIPAVDMNVCLILPREVPLRTPPSSVRHRPSHRPSAREWDAGAAEPLMLLFIGRTPMLAQRAVIVYRTTPPPPPLPADVADVDSAANSKQTLHWHAPLHIASCVRRTCRRLSAGPA